MVDARLELKSELNRVFREVFDDDTIEIFDEMTAQNIPEWDSLMHIILVVAVEKKFKVRLNAAEVGNLKNVGAMLDLLAERSTKKTP